MAVQTVVIRVGDPRFANATPGMITQIQSYLRRVTVEEVRRVERKQPGEKYIYRVDNRFDRPVFKSQWKIQAFWQLPGNGEILRRIWAATQAETYKYVKRRTGLLGNSWRVYFKPPTPGEGKNTNTPVLVAPSFPQTVRPGSTYSFINVAPYGSLMSRYSAIIALRGSIAKSVAKAKPSEEAKIGTRLRKLTRSVFYTNTPAGYSTVVRIRKAARRTGGPKLATIRAFDLAPTGNLSYLKRISGVAVTFFKRLSPSDITKQGRAK